MTDPKSFLLSPRLHEYLLAHSSPVDDALVRLARRTAALGDVAAMQVAPEQGMLLRILTAALGARSVVEVGTFTGYSAICLAQGLAPGGRLLCCDVSEEWTAIAREAWAEAGLADRIDLRVAPALETLRSLPQEPTLDLAFVDADKESYVAYHEELVPRLRPGGLLLVDNVLWSGTILEEDSPDPNQRALRAYNTHAATDERLDLVVLPVADGLTLALRR